MVLDQLTRFGLIVQADGDHLIVRPKERITDEIRQFIKTHKPEILTALNPHCGSCARFIPDPVNPPAGYGNCSVTGRGHFPAPRPGCEDFLPGLPLSQVEAKGEKEICKLLESSHQGLALNVLLERLPFRSRDIGRSLAVLQGRGQVFVEVRGGWSFYRLKTRAQMPLPEAIEEQSISSIIEGD